LGKKEKLVNKRGGEKEETLQEVSSPSLSQGREKILEEEHLKKEKRP